MTASPGNAVSLSRLEASGVALATALAVVVPAVAILDVSFAGRSVLAVVSVVLVPGASLALVFRHRSRMVTVALTVALSIAAHLVASTAVVLLSAPLLIVPALLAGVSLVITGWLLRHGVTIHVRPRRYTADPRWRYGSLAFLAIALYFWWHETRIIDLNSVGSLGLIGNVGWSFLVANSIIAFVVTISLLRPLDPVVLLAALGSLMTVNYLLVNVADGVGGFSTGWVHVGFIDYINVNGTTAEGIDARFSWPGFFALGAVLVSTAGLSDASPLLLASPLVMNVLIVPALYVLGRTITKSPRLAWAGIFIYQIFNWFHQDYFAPQATATVLYTTIIGVLLWQLFNAKVSPGSRSGIAGLIDVSRRVPDRIGSAGATIGGLLVVLFLAIAMIVSHQLTPVVLILVLFGFTVCGAIRARGTWLVVGLLFVAWFSYAATDYWVGHLAVVLGDVGEVGQTVSSGVVDRIGLDPTYQTMQHTRMAWSAIYGLLGVAGLAVLWLRRQRFTLVVAGLVAAPFSLVLLQSYGGEVFLRCFVYAAPVLAPLSAVAAHAALGPVARRLCSRSNSRVLTGVSVVALSAVVLAGSLMLTATRGLNVSFERVTSTHSLAATQIFDQAESGDSVAQFGALGALGAGLVGDIDRDDMTLFLCSDPDGPGGEPVGALPVAEAVDCVIAERPDWIYVTSTQLNALHLEQGTDQQWAMEMLRGVAASADYELIVDAGDVKVLRLQPEGA